jgi:broad specificity phosphatase PhoE
MMDGHMVPTIYLVRHGETEWSVSGQHTGRTDVRLTARGEAQARRLAERLRGVAFARVWSSPLQRARATCELAGFGGVMEIEPALVEWDYGEYEGITTAEIHARDAQWNVFEHGGPGGESPEDVSRRADGIVARLRTVEGNAAVFSHGHFLRALAARWIGRPVREGRRFLLHTASTSILSCEHHNIDEPAVALWNAVEA